MQLPERREANVGIKLRKREREKERAGRIENITMHI
jgi:hypothetical protein